MGRLLGKVETAFEVLVERHAVAEQILDAAPRLAARADRDLFVDDASAGADGVGGMRLRDCRLRQSAAAMPACAQTLDPPWPKGETDTTVTGIGASFSAVNRPARPAPTMTMPPLFRLARTPLRPRSAPFVTIERSVWAAT